MNPETFLKEAVIFFSKRQWDSTLVYSQKLIETSSSQKQIDFSHFLRGYSFNKKKIFKEAEKEYLKVSKKMEFYNQVIAYLGVLALEQSKYKKAIDYLNEVINLPEKEFKSYPDYS